jgi:hypothetical protein
MDMFKCATIVSLFYMAVLFDCSKTSVSPEQVIVTEMQKKVQDISSEVALVRGMNFLRPVRVGVVSKEQYKASMSRNIASSISNVEESALSKEFAQMGFLAETDTPLNHILTDFYASFPAAFYELGTDSLTIIEDTYDNDIDLSIMVAHELTHALQDQNLTTRPTIFPGYSGYNSDATLAEHSVMEGDAMFTEIAYYYKSYVAEMVPGEIAPFDSSFRVANDYKIRMASGTFAPDAPIFLDIKNSVPYFFGVAYVAKTYQDGGGWNAVNNLYSISATPRSSAEINLASPLSITYFDFHGIQDLLVSGPGAIDYADDDNAGFALLLGLFYGNLDTARVGRSLGWRGDRYTYVKRAGQAYGTLVWAMAFADKEASAYMFGKLAGKIGGRKLAGNSAVVDSAVDSLGRGSTYTFTSASATTKLRRFDEQIWWVENTDTLTQKIMDILDKQKFAPALAKEAKSGSLTASLSGETKMRVIEGIAGHMFRQTLTASHFISP